MSSVYEVSEIQLNDKHLALYEQLVHQWAEYFGLRKRWEWYVGFDPQEKKRMGGVAYAVHDRIATVLLSNPYRDSRPLTAHVLSRIACHEVAHVLLAPLSEWAEEGKPNAMSLGDIEHEIVHTLTQNALTSNGHRIVDMLPAFVKQAFPD